MSTFRVPVLTLDSIQTIPGAETIEAAVVGGYKVVVRKGAFQAGEPVVYIPSDSVIPAELADRVGIRAYLAGKDKSRVKPVRLGPQKTLSEGIVLSTALFPGVALGADLQDVLGITKYEEEIPAHLSGVVRPWPMWLPKYDIESAKKPEYHHVVQPGERVIVLEKIDGSNCAIGFDADLPASEAAYVCSRNQAVLDAPDNGYWRAVHAYGLVEKTRALLAAYAERSGEPVRHGAVRFELVGVQKLMYGFTKGRPGVAAFDVFVNGRYLDKPLALALMVEFGIPTAPVLYDGPFDYALIEALADGRSVLYPQHMREGVVISPAVERHAEDLGRVMVKIVGAEYLTSKFASYSH